MLVVYRTLSTESKAFSSVIGTLILLLLYAHAARLEMLRQVFIITLVIQEVVFQVVLLFLGTLPHSLVTINRERIDI